MSETNQSKDIDRLEKDIIKHRHDRFFRGALDNLLVAKELIETHLPGIKKFIDFDSLKHEKDTFIDKDLQKAACDVLFSAKINGEDGFIFILFEHQSKPDYWMAFRLMKYMINICCLYLENHPEAKKLPLVCPLVLYNGKQQYKVPRKLWDLFTNPELARVIWSEDHMVINVHKISDEELLRKVWSGSLQFLMKHIYDEDIISSWEQLKGVIPRLTMAKDIGLKYIQLMLYYSLTAVKKDDKVEVEKVVKSYLAENSEGIMGSLARHWLEEGFEKGRAEGIEQGIEKTAINMLKKGLDIKFVAEVTGLSMLQVQKLKARL